MIVTVAGSRGFLDYSVVEKKLDRILHCFGIEVLLHGDCIRNRDILADKWARRNRVYCVRVPADWRKEGKHAGPLRNAIMISVTDLLVAFWDGKSRGTADIIRQARERSNFHVIQTDITLVKL